MNTQVSGDSYFLFRFRVDVDFSFIASALASAERTPLREARPILEETK